MVESSEILATSAVRGTGNETITRQLSAATYYVRAARYSGDTAYQTLARRQLRLRDSRQRLGLVDAGLAVLTQSLFVDGSLSRDDMIVASCGRPVVTTTVWTPWNWPTSGRSWPTQRIPAAGSRAEPGR